ncbi:MAG: nucleotidyltransferase domain-containing protein [Lachnospiraceae bacterium]
MCTQNELQIILNHMVHVYQDIYQEDIYKIYLYGSYARGDYTAESDVDIVAIVRGDRKELQEKLKNV